LIGRGVPQRSAHHLVGRLVREATERGVRLAELPLAVFQEADPRLDAAVYEVLGAEKAVAAMRSYGSTGPAQVREQIGRWQQLLDDEAQR